MEYFIVFKKKSRPVEILLSENKPDTERQILHDFTHMLGQNT